MPKTIQRQPTHPPVGDTFLTTADLAERYRTNENTVRYWRHTGYGPTGTRIGKRVLYKLSECERWEDEQAKQEAAG